MLPSQTIELKTSGNLLHGQDATTKREYEITYILVFISMYQTILHKAWEQEWQMPKIDQVSVEIAMDIFVMSWNVWRIGRLIMILFTISLLIEFEYSKIRTYKRALQQRIPHKDEPLLEVIDVPGIDSVISVITFRNLMPWQLNYLCFKYEAIFRRKGRGSVHLSAAMKWYQLKRWGWNKYRLCKDWVNKISISAV